MKNKENNYSVLQNKEIRVMVVSQVYLLSTMTMERSSQFAKLFMYGKSAILHEERIIGSRRQDLKQEKETQAATGENKRNFSQEQISTGRIVSAQNRCSS